MSVIKGLIKADRALSGGVKGKKVVRSKRAMVKADYDFYQGVDNTTKGLRRFLKNAFPYIEFKEWMVDEDNIETFEGMDKVEKEFGYKNSTYDKIIIVKFSLPIPNIAYIRKSMMNDIVKELIPVAKKDGLYPIEVISGTNYDTETSEHELVLVVI